ncbi:MAG: outer membrane lipoprotein carrier protein LolA, partial [Tannerella sp.]|nr:outer membrane lipoprotein carrier protein LolA [Tannerella sp.]
MKKSVLILICVLSGCFFASAQYRSATEAEKNAIVEGMKKAAEGMNSLQCDFVQVKELSFMDDKVTSEGKMFFKKPDRIRWEYVKPY